MKLQSSLKQWSKPLCRHLLIGSSIVLVMWNFGISFCFNVDDSVHYAFFLAKLNPINIPRGAYVIFEHIVLNEKKRLIKKVIGITHDEIKVKNNEVWVNEAKVGEIKSYSKTGLPLSPIQESCIPEGFIFAAGTHPDSFDSRYENFGLVPICEVLARAYPVF